MDTVLREYGASLLTLLAGAAGLSDLPDIPAWAVLAAGAGVAWLWSGEEE